MNLQRLLQGVDILSSTGGLDKDIAGVASDSRAVEPGYAFVCYEGVNVDGHTFIPQAAPKRRNDDYWGETGTRAARCHLYPNAKRAHRLLAYCSQLVRESSRSAEVLIGITGTNGKTSTAHLAHSIFKAAGLKSGLMGTVGTRYADVFVEPTITTLEPLALHKLFRDIANAGVDYVIMETSSQGLAQHRLAGLTFETAVFTNLTQDHLDYHETMEEYLNAKMMLFQQLNPDNGIAILNADDPASDSIRKTVNPPNLTFGVEGPADLSVSNVESTLKRLSFVANTPKGKIPASLHLLGDYNLYNALAAIGIGLHHDCSIEAIQTGLESTVVPGRFELVDRGQPFAVIVDYAHTPDGLENLLTAARKITQGNLISVLGCGGDRDRGKRPKMGNISATIADHSVITSDNPRTEEPDAILADIVEGLPDDASYDLIQDRRIAIGHAIELAKAGDLVTIAGKGHEPYQEINGVRFDFDDREVAAEFLDQLK